MAQGLSRQTYVFFGWVAGAVLVTGLLVFLLTGGDDTAINIDGIPPPGDADAPTLSPPTSNFVQPSGDAGFEADSTIPVILEMTPQELDDETFELAYRRAMRDVAEAPPWVEDTEARCERGPAPCKCFWKGLQKAETVFGGQSRTGAIKAEDGSLPRTLNLLDGWYREFRQACPNEKQQVLGRAMDKLQTRREEAVNRYLEAKGRSQYADAMNLMALDDIEAIEVLELCTGLAPTFCDCHKALGLALARRGAKAEAEARLEHYLERCPGLGGAKTVQQLMAQAEEPVGSESESASEAGAATPVQLKPELKASPKKVPARGSVEFRMSTTPSPGPLVQFELTSNKDGVLYRSDQPASAPETISCKHGALSPGPHKVKLTVTGPGGETASKGIKIKVAGGSQKRRKGRKSQGPPCRLRHSRESGSPEKNMDGK